MPLDYDSAVEVESIRQEYEIIEESICGCGGGYKVESQSLHFDPQKRPYDLIRATCKRCGREKEFLFDVSSFFGR